MAIFKAQYVIVGALNQIYILDALSVKQTYCLESLAPMMLYA